MDQKNEPTSTGRTERQFELTVRGVCLVAFGVSFALLAVALAWFASPWLPIGIRWLWELDSAPAPERMGTVAVALFVSFLTIVALWQIPPGWTESPPDKPSHPPSGALSPFTSRYAQTVLAGLGGLLITEVAKSVNPTGNSLEPAATRWFYIVWFVSSFFALLVLLNGCRALVECLRAGATIQWHGRNWTIYVLTFIDTFFNLIQGKNQTRTKVIEQQIIDQQATLARIADSIREELARFLEKKLSETPTEDEAGTEPNKKRIRVNVSVLSKNRRELFYISRTVGSSLLRFPKESVAWISVQAGEPRWNKAQYRNNKQYSDFVLYENHFGVIPFLPKTDLRLKDYYQRRVLEDYDAFVVIPFPVLREQQEGDPRGALHISFLRDSDFETLWDIPGAEPKYENAREKIRKSRNADVDSRIRATLAILEPVINGVNETLFFRSRNKDLMQS